MLTPAGIEEARVRLRELHADEWSDLALAALAMGMAVVAAALHSRFALPLFIGALGVGFLGARAFLRRLDLFERLLLDRDAYSIPEVRHRADEIASMNSRRRLAESVRSWVAPTAGSPVSPRVLAARPDLEALASELANDDLLLDPVSAVYCRELLTDATRSPLLNEFLPADDLRARVLRIRSGFEPRATADSSTEEIASVP